jgi:hypothetical protein
MRLGSARTVSFCTFVIRQDGYQHEYLEITWYQGISSELRAMWHTAREMVKQRGRHIDWTLR